MTAPKSFRIMSVMSTNTPATITTTSALDTTADALTTTIAGWLLGFGSTNTRDAYARDLHKWLDFATAADLDAFDAKRAHVDGWVRTLEAEGLAASTIARRIAAVASFYEYAVDEDHIVRNPAAKVKRPKVSDVSNTSAPDKGELSAMLEAAADSPTDQLLVLLLALNGLRVSEAIALDIEHIERLDGHTIATVTGKGGKVDHVPLPPRTVAAIESLGIESGPLLLNASGARMDRHAAAYVIERLARAAGLDKKITPHSLRHAAVTVALAAGVPLHRVQDMARHADPRTTRRYDRARGNLDNHAAYTVATAID